MTGEGDNGGATARGSRIDGDAMARLFVEVEKRHRQRKWAIGSRFSSNRYYAMRDRRPGNSASMGGIDEAMEWEEGSE